MGLGDFHIEGLPGGPFRVGSLKWTLAIFAVYFLLVFLLGFLFAPASGTIAERLLGIARFSALLSLVATAITSISAWRLRMRKRAPLSKEHRLRQR